MLEIFYTFKKYWEVLRQEAQEGFSNIFQLLTKNKTLAMTFYSHISRVSSRKQRSSIHIIFHS